MSSNSQLNGSLFRPWLDWSGEKSSELKFTAQSKVVAPPHVKGASSIGVLSVLNQPQITLARFLPPRLGGLIGWVNKSPQVE